MVVAGSPDSGYPFSPCVGTDLCLTHAGQNTQHQKLFSCTKFIFEYNGFPPGLAPGKVVITNFMGTSFNPFLLFPTQVHLQVLMETYCHNLKQFSRYLSQSGKCIFPLGDVFEIL